LVAKKLKKIKGINNFITSCVSSMRGMFNECNELEYLNLSNFNTSNVEDMGWMFNGCNKLKEIKGIENFNTIKDIDKLNISAFKLEKLITVLPKFEVM